MSSSPTTYETVRPQSRDQRLPAESFQDWNIRTRVQRRISQRGATEDTIVSLISIAVALVFIGGIVLVGYFGGSAKCANRARLMEVEHSFALFQGCMVKYRGHWLPIEAIREVGIGGEQ